MPRYVKTNYVPEHIDYLTPGKVYALSDDDEFGGDIIDDTGVSITIYYEDSSHLGDLGSRRGRPWTLCDANGDPL